MWSAARRLAWLVAGTLALVAIPFVLDARIGVLPAASGGLAITLLAVALLPLLHARQILRACAAPAKVPAAVDVYRTSALPTDHEPAQARATRDAALALLLLSVAGALTIVAAAAR